MDEAKRLQLEKEADDLIRQAAGQAPLEEDKLQPEVVTPQPEETPPKPVAEQDKDQPPAEMKDGLTVENAEARLMNAEASYQHARKRMNQAANEAAELKRENESLSLENEMLKKRITELEGRIVTAPVEPPAAQPAEQTLDSVTQQYGEDFRPVVNALNTQGQEMEAMHGEVADVKKQMADMAVAKAEAEKKAALAEHCAAIRAGHADAFEIYETAEFQGWLLKQPPTVQQIMKSGYADDVIWVISEYKKTLTQQTSTLEQARQEADPNVSSLATRPSSEGPLQFTREQIAAMSLEEYMANQEAIDTWMANQSQAA